MGSAAGAEVDDPICGGDHIEVVFHDQHAVARVAELEEGLDEKLDIAEVESGGGFVEEVERVGGGRLGEFEGEFEALRFAAGECVGRLTERQIAEAELIKGCENETQLWDRLEKCERFRDLEVEDIGDRFPFVGDREGFAVEAFAIAGGAGDPCVGQEMHFDFESAVALAAFAASARSVETEA